MSKEGWHHIRHHQHLSDKLPKRLEKIPGTLLTSLSWELIFGTKRSVFSHIQTIQGKSPCKYETTDKHKKVVKSTHPSVRVSGVSFLTRASVVPGVVVTQ